MTFSFSLLYEYVRGLDLGLGLGVGHRQFGHVQFAVSGEARTGTVLQFCPSSPPTQKSSKTSLGHPSEGHDKTYTRIR